MSTQPFPNQAAFESVREMIRPCIQCGTCSASCPNQFAMDLTPRHLWRLVLMDQAAAVFESQTFILCSSCYYCALRCPRGLPLTDAMAALKQISHNQSGRRHRKSMVFYREFVESIRRDGRINEMALMARYFIHMKNPLLPLRHAPLGIRLIAEKKLSLARPKAADGKLDALFNAVMEKDTL